MVEIIGADTTAGSTLHFLSTSGRIDETSDAHKTMAATDNVTVSVTSGPTPSVQARTNAAAAMAAAISTPVDISLVRIAGMSRKRTCPVAMARTIVVVIWVPVL